MMSGFDREHQSWYESACALIDQDRLTELIVGMVNIPSPTGEEAELSRWLTTTFKEAELDATYQAIDDKQANSIARLRGSGDGEDLLLYAPIDTLTVGEPEEDVPWIGSQLRDDMRTIAEVKGDFVMGLGASNPKGHAAAIIAAAEVIAKAQIPLRGDLLIGMGAGGMPTNGRITESLNRHNTGHGVGCSFMLEQGWWADHALIVKPGWSVAWEEVGLCWFEVRVRGTYTYVGSRHRMPYHNAIDNAGTVISELEQWFPEYAARHTDGLVAPQGVVSSIESGWARMAAVTPALCRFKVDLRTNPRSSPADIRREFAAAISDICNRNPDIDLDWDMVLSIPGTETSQEAPIVVAATSAWEEVVGRPHDPILANSGATDANILRSRGLPTARIGMDRIGPEAPLELDFASGQNVVDIREAVRLTQAIVHTVIAVCTKERSST